MRDGSRTRLWPVQKDLLDQVCSFWCWLFQSLQCVQDAVMLVSTPVASIEVVDDSSYRSQLFAMRIAVCQRGMSCPVNFEVESEMETRPELEEVSAPLVTQAAEPSHRSWLSGFTKHFFYTARLVLEELLHCASEIKREDRDGECIMNMEIFRSPPHPVALICINLYIICVIESSILAWNVVVNLQLSGWSTFVLATPNPRSWYARATCARPESSIPKGRLVQTWRGLWCLIRCERLFKV